MMYTLQILECNEISTPHQMTKKRIEELGSRYFFISNIFLFRLEYLILALNRGCAFPCLYTFVHLSLVVILTFFFITGTIIFWFFAPQDSASARLRCSLVILWDILDPREMPWGRG